MSLLDGLLHWWELDTTGWLDSHGTWNLTNRTAVSINSTGAPDGGPAAVFDGSHYLDRTNVAWDGSGAARSVQIWARYSALSGTGNWLVSHRGNTVSTIIHHTFISNPASPFFDAKNVRHSIGDGTTNIVLGGPENPATNTWFHIVAASNGINQHRLYINGDLVDEDTTTLSGVIASGQPFSIGVSSWSKNSTGTHRGLACLAAVWERELTSDEATALYNSGSALRYAALDLTGGSGAKIARLRRAHAEMRGMRA